VKRYEFTSITDIPHYRVLVSHQKVSLLFL